MSLKQPVSPRTRRSNLQLYGSPNSPDEDRVFWKDAPYLGLPNIGPPTDEYFCYNRTQEEIDHQYKIYSLIPKLPTRKIGKTAIEREEMWNRLLSYIPRKESTSTEIAEDDTLPVLLETVSRESSISTNEQLVTSNNTLNAFTRNKLADLVLNKTMTAKEVTENYDVSTAQLKKLISNRQKRGYNCDSKGRRSSLDSISDQIIKSQFNATFPCLEFETIGEFRDNLKDLVKREATLTNERNNKNKVIATTKKSIISSRTVLRYTNFYMNELIKFVVIKT